MCTSLLRAEVELGSLAQNWISDLKIFTLISAAGESRLGVAKGVRREPL